MLKIGVKMYDKNCIYLIKINKKVGKEYSLWIRMIDIENGLDVENDLVLERKGLITI